MVLSISAKCFESIPDYAQRLDKILALCIKDVGGVERVAILMCSLFALLYIGNMVWQSWCKGESINIYAMFRPFVVGLVISNFTLFVGVLDDVCGWMNIPAQSLVSSCAQKGKDGMSNNLKEKQKALMDRNRKHKAEEINDGDVITNGEVTYLDMEEYANDQEGKGEESSSWKDALANLIVRGIMKGLTDILSLISLVFAVGILTVAFTSKLILIYLGPFAFALSLIPYFSRSLPNWIGRYITVSLYAPCINIICFAILCIMQHSMPSVSNDAEIGMGYGVILSLASTLCFLSIPSLSNYIVESCGAGGVTGESRHAAMNVMNKVKGRFFSKRQGEVAKEQ